MKDTYDNISYILNIFGRGSDSNDVDRSAQRNTHESVERNRGHEGTDAESINVNASRIQALRQQEQ